MVVSLMTSLMGILIASFLHEFFSFIFFYGVMFIGGLGTLSGIFYMQVYQHLDYTPFMLAQGFGALIFSVFSDLYCNPKNLSPQIIIPHPEINDYNFSEEVASCVPSIFRIMGVAWFTLSIAAITILPKSSGFNDRSSLYNSSIMIHDDETDNVTAS